MRLSDLQSKDVIDINDGKRIGNIIDIVIKDGQLVSLIIEKSRLFSKFTNKNEIEVTWKQIIKIGEDVILVNFEM